MNEKETENKFFNPFSEDWTNTSSKFWDNAFKFQNESMESLTGFMDFFNKASSKPKPDNLLKMGNSINKFVVSFFNKPENLIGFAATSEMLPMLITNLSQNLAASFAEIQNILVDKSSRFGSNLKELNLNDFNAGIFTIWKELYKSDFKKFYNIPQLGLTRNYQEQINTTLDTGNQFFMAFSEVMNLLYIPVEKAGNMTVEKYQELLDNNELPDDPKVIYKLWIKALEGYYMQVLQSPEYSKALNSVISTQSEHKKSQGKILQTFLHQLQIPTNIEMDELYKEIYLLKKKLRGLEKKLTVKEKATSTKKKPAGTKKSTDAKTSTVKKASVAKKPVTAKAKASVAKKPVAAKAKASAAKKPVTAKAKASAAKKPVAAKAKASAAKKPVAAKAKASAAKAKAPEKTKL